MPNEPSCDFSSKAPLKLLRCQGRAEGLGTRLRAEQEAVVLARVGHCQFEVTQAGTFGQVHRAQVQQESAIALDGGRQERRTGICCGGRNVERVRLHLALGVEQDGAGQE